MSLTWANKEQYQGQERYPTDSYLSMFSFLRLALLSCNICWYMKWSIQHYWMTELLFIYPREGECEDFWQNKILVATYQFHISYTNSHFLSMGCKWKNTLKHTLAVTFLFIGGELSPVNHSWVLVSFKKPPSLSVSVIYKY